MQNVQDGYLLVDSTERDSRLFAVGHRFKVGATLVGSSCLVLCILAFSVTQHNSNVTESTNLFNLVNAKSGLASRPFMGSMSHQPQLSQTTAHTRKSIIAAGDFRQGDSIEYYSPSNGDWIPAKVLAINSKGEVKISVKADTWLNEAQQAKSLKKKNTFFGFSFGSDKFKDNEQYTRMKYKDVDTGPGYSWDSESMTEAYARVRESRKKYFEQERRDQEAREKGGLAQVLNQVTGALDFQENIEADKGLLNAAKRMKKGDTMSDEQYGALKRKVGGTKGGFFGETVEVIGTNTDKGFVDESKKLPGWAKWLR